MPIVSKLCVCVREEGRLAHSRLIRLIELEDASLRSLQALVYISVACMTSVIALLCQCLHCLRSAHDKFLCDNVNR